MSDLLVDWLNERGYQPVFMPPTGVTPPDLYYFVDGRLERVGTLKSYLSDDVKLPDNERGELPDIQLRQTSAKTLKGAARFLDGALQAIGIQKTPGLDLSFAGKGDVVFKLVGTSYKETPTAEVVKLIQKLQKELIPCEYLEAGNLHVVYHYAYATSLEMRRADSKKFEGNVSAVEIQNIANLGVKATVEVQNGNALLFNAKTRPIAFAYKAAQLRRAGKRLEFLPGIVKHFTGQITTEEQAANYLPSPGLVLRVENW